MTDDTDNLVDEYDIDARDQINHELFRHVQDLRLRGNTPKEIVPRLRGLADSMEDHFGHNSLWDECPAEKDVILPGDTDDY